MEFAIGQVHVSIKIVNFQWGTRSVMIKANGTISDCKLAAEITISENNRPLDINVIVETIESHAKESTS